VDGIAEVALTLRREAELVGVRLAEIERRRAEHQAGLTASQGKLWRAGLGTLVGMALLDVTSGVSLVVAFWTSTSLLVDRLDLGAQMRALDALDAEIGQLNGRLAALAAELDALGGTAPNP
jgi:hypothetical protein